MSINLKVIQLTFMFYKRKFKKKKKGHLNVLCLSGSSISSAVYHHDLREDKHLSKRQPLVFMVEVARHHISGAQLGSLTVEVTAD